MEYISEMVLYISDTYRKSHGENMRKFKYELMEAGIDMDITKDINIISCVTDLAGIIVCLRMNKIVFDIKINGRLY